MSVNKVILIGNVGQDPKITYYEGGNCVAQLSLATTEKGYTLQNGTQIPDRTEWHNLIFRGRLGEIVEKYVHKGDKLYVEGKIRTRSYLHFLIFINFCIFLFIFLQPAHCMDLLSLLLIGVSILVGHLFVLTNSKAANLFFIGSMTGLILLFCFNVWTLL